MSDMAIWGFVILIYGHFIFRRSCKWHYTVTIDNQHSAFAQTMRIWVLIGAVILWPFAAVDKVAAIFAKKYLAKKGQSQ